MHPTGETLWLEAWQRRGWLSETTWIHTGRWRELLCKVSVPREPAIWQELHVSWFAVVWNTRPYMIEMRVGILANCQIRRGLWVTCGRSLYLTSLAHFRICGYFYKCLIDPYLFQILSPDSLSWWNFLLSCSTLEGALCYIPCAALASVLIFWPYSHHFFFFPKLEISIFGGFLPCTTYVLFESQLPALPPSSLLLSSLIPKLPILTLIFFRLSKKTHFYRRASAHAVPSACSSPSSPHLGDLPCKSLFQPLFKTSPLPYVLWHLIQFYIVLFVLLTFFFLYCQISHLDFIKATAWCDSIIAASLCI